MEEATYLAFPVNEPREPLFVLLFPTKLTGFRACTCTGEDHPGPSTNVGRGAPQIGIFELEKSATSAGGKAVQSFTFAPFDASYAWSNASQDLSFHTQSATMNPARWVQGSCVSEDVLI